MPPLSRSSSSPFPLLCSLYIFILVSLVASIDAFDDAEELHSSFVNKLNRDVVETHSSRYIGDRVVNTQKGFKRVHSDLYIHSRARGFNYDLKNIANEFQLLGHPSSIDIKHNELSAADSNALYVITDVSPLRINNDDIVTITFRSSNPTSNDFIAAYSPANVSINEKAPVKWGYCDGNASYITNGIGSLTFNFTNLRDDIAFYFFTAQSYDNYDNPDLANTTSQFKYSQVNK